MYQAVRLATVNRERTLAAVALVLVLVGGAIAALAPGATAQETDDPVPESRLDLREPRVSAGQVSTGTATVALDVRMDHSGGPAENVTVEVQAIDEQTGLVETTVREPIGNVTEDGEVRTVVNASVERQGGYRFDIRVYEDGERVATGYTRVSGVGSLTPDRERTGATFQRFASANTDLPSITFSVGETTDNRTTLETRTFLTNDGDEPTETVELLVRARQTDSNIVAARERVSVGAIEPGTTVAPTVSLEVPDDYNYHLDAVLFSDGAVVETASAGAVLDPSLPAPENGTANNDTLETSDFELDGGAADGPDQEAETPVPTTESAGGGPGFGAPVAVVAVLAAAVLAYRARSHP